ncbi:glycogen debranching N-terminal domain-containing protein [Leifsonia virtsii]|uniref:Glycogen debranching N-terminal domain-containing protein n=1 Tax=Leifsonia virtsii TaxID=3035915 RepID=A0ABT8IW13_9MICO|nr:glycogen debranching N-terminal domain-containing protein [Leifsonia virtsii]MDN4596995.1 glycogen debranching N-terminal domain-containing protein [Leifsonia virtsii]
MSRTETPHTSSPPTAAPTAPPSGEPGIRTTDPHLPGDAPATPDRHEGTTSTMTQPLQPLLHDSVVVLTAPSQAWSAPDGRIDGHGIHGFYHSDLRVLDRVLLTVGDEVPEHIATAGPDAATSVFTSLARGLDDATADPRVRVERTRSVQAGSLTERIVLRNALRTAVATTVEVVLGADFSPMQSIKAGLSGSEHPVTVEAGAGGATAVLRSGRVEARIVAEGATATVDGDRVSLRWNVEAPANGSAELAWRIDVDDPTAVVSGAEPSAEWSAFRATTGDSRMQSWLGRAVADLQALRMSTVERPDDTFLAAGAPWFFTLFGRDSLWAARMLLPLGHEIAASTLRVLAHYQGTKTVAETAEQPGKIMHELRPAALTIPGEGVELPPLYYGTVDATALWVCLLHDAWKWGMPRDEVEPLLPHLEAALAWMRDVGDSDGDGFLEYIDTTGHGLANQGWKDSGDSIQWRDGTLADGPIALCEVQGYAYEAAVGGAELLDAFGREGANEWRAWAADLKARFASAFWIDDPAGAYPAVALDAAKRKVDTVTSNIGHLLGTGILDPEESALVARRLVSPELSSGYGLRTMSTDSAGYWPLSYHGGSVWAHDTAIAISGLAAEGFRAEAGQLADGLLAAALGFGYRMPELHSGDSTAQTVSPIPYPAACRPQAWSAAAAVAVLSARLGLRADAPAGRLEVDPDPDAGSIHVEGLRFGGVPRRVTV